MTLLELIIIGLVANFTLSGLGQWMLDGSLVIEGGGTTNTNVPVIEYNKDITDAEMNPKLMLDFFKLKNNNTLFFNLGAKYATVNAYRSASWRGNYGDLEYDIGLRQEYHKNIYGELFYRQKKESNLFNINDSKSYESSLIGYRLLLNSGYKYLKSMDVGKGLSSDMGTYLATLFSPSESKWFSSASLMTEIDWVAGDISTLSNSGPYAQLILDGDLDIYEQGLSCIYLNLKGKGALTNSKAFRELIAEIGWRHVQYAKIYGELFYSYKIEKNLFDSSDNNSYYSTLIGYRLSLGDGYQYTGYGE